MKKGAHGLHRLLFGSFYISSELTASGGAATAYGRLGNGVQQCVCLLREYLPTDQRALRAHIGDEYQIAVR